MASAVSGRDPICRYICETLGLDPLKTQSIQINMRSGSLVSVTAEILPDRREMEIIGILLEEYKLIAKEELEGGQNEGEGGEEFAKGSSEDIPGGIIPH